MVKLTVEQRRKLPKTAFACPATRDYPINDPSRVASAKSYFQRKYTKKCPRGKQRICAAARKFGMMKPEFSGAAKWKAWCGK